MKVDIIQPSPSSRRERISGCLCVWHRGFFLFPIVDCVGTRRNSLCSICSCGCGAAAREFAVRLRPRLIDFGSNGLITAPVGACWWLSRKAGRLDIPVIRRDCETSCWRACVLGEGRCRRLAKIVGATIQAGCHTQARTALEQGRLGKRVDVSVTLAQLTDSPTNMHRRHFRQLRLFQPA